VEIDLPGPVGERTHYRLHPRGIIYIAPQSQTGFIRLLTLTLASGNLAILDAAHQWQSLVQSLPAAIAERIMPASPENKHKSIAGALIEGEGIRVQNLVTALTMNDGPLFPIQSASSAELSAELCPFNINLLLEEQSLSTNTTAAGGNASLMTLA
ncbi:MAG: trifunctional transcriptional regulator/proline dehydrogenase/L-glutamate gamma-semialdehyde dehydrogenase, partial [Beijerinckiaceae bacterium]